MRRPSPREQHLTGRVGWLRAAVLGANDGLVSVGSPVLGVSASQANHGSGLIAGISAWIAGAMSMAAGEYVSVSSQADASNADIEVEWRELQGHPRQQQELAGIYVERGLSLELADQLATQRMAHDGLEAHARNEIGISTNTAARPLQAALTSELTFTLGVIPPLVVIWVVPVALMWGAVSRRRTNAPFASFATPLGRGRISAAGSQRVNHCLDHSRSHGRVHRQQDRQHVR